MQKEQITDKQAIYIVVVFIIGSSLIIGIGGDAKNDAWIAAIVGSIFALPMLLIYSRILSLFEGKDLFDILELTFGKILGKIISIVYIWYSFHLGALVLRNFGEFIDIVAMPETPRLVPILCLGLVCIFAVKLGIEIIGRTTAYFFPILLFIILLVQMLCISHLHFHFLKPVFGDGIIPILKGGFSTFSFPFAETILFIGIFSSLKTSKAPYRAYFWGILIGLVIILLTTIRNITVLGNMVGHFYFPSYAAVSRISIGDFIQRFEVTVGFVFIFSVFIKSSICLLVTCKGICKVLNLENYRSIVIQTGLLMIYFSHILYDNVMEMKYWAFKVYSYYAFPMQVILPIIIWIFAEIKSKKLSSQSKGKEFSDTSS